MGTWVWSLPFRRRDWLYVEDHCRAVDAILQKGKPGEVYNISGNYELTNLELVKRICRELRKPETRFDEGIRRTIRWYLDNRSWWEEAVSGERRLVHRAKSS